MIQFSSFLKFAVFAVLLAGTSMIAPVLNAGKIEDLESRLLSHLRLPAGFQIKLYAADLGTARLMVLTKTGDIILSTPASKILLVEADRNNDGRADNVRTLMSGLKGPHGLWLDEGWLYIAEEGRVSRIKYDDNKRRTNGSVEVLVPNVPDGSGHWTRTIKKGPDGWFYLTIGSSCNICIERHDWRAAMIRFRPGGKPEYYAGGLRNTVGFDWHPVSGKLYGVDNGRDWLGDNFPPDELNEITQNGFYGWPYFNGDNVKDPDYGGRFADAPAEPRPPAYKFDAHIAPLSIRFLRHQPAVKHNNTALVAQHGSWNRSTKIGYQVVQLRWTAGNKITSQPFLTGFEKNGRVTGRPVDVIESGDGTIYVSDDYAGVIWRITPTPAK